MGTSKRVEKLPLLISTQVDNAASSLDSRLHRCTGRWQGLWPTNNRSKGMILVAMSAFTFSLLSTLIKYASMSMPSMETVFWRSFVALFLNLAAVRSSGVSLRVPKKHRLALMTRCLFGSVSMSLSFYAMQQMILADASVLIFTSPILTFFLGGIVLGERIDPASFGCALFSFVGVICVVRPTFLFGHGSSQDVYSDASILAVMCALFAALGQAVVYVSMRHLKQLHFLVVIHYFLVTATLLSGVSLALVKHVFIVHLSIKVWAAVLSTGILGFIGQLCLTRGFQLQHAGPASVMRYLDIVFVFVWDITLLGEHVNGWSVLGALIITSCAITIALRKSQS